MRTVSRAFPLALSLSIAVAATAQQPAPAAETHQPDWSPVEAQALTWLQERRSHALERRVELPREGIGIRQYRILFFQATADGLEPATALGPGTHWFALAWPTNADATAQRGLLLHDDGTTLVCQLEPGATCDPAAGLVVAKGSKGAFADVLRQPGTGEQGHLWLWLDQVSARDQVLVTDGKGRPLPGAQVSVVPAGTGPRHVTRLPRPVPIGRARTAESGIAALRGPRCGDVAVAVTVGTDTARRDAIRVEPREGTLVLAVPEDALVNQKALANESAAIATLRNIASAQMQCQASSAIDVDRDGNGEFGGFLELTGKAVLRGTDNARMSPPVLSSALSKVDDGVVSRSGYCFQLWLPGKDGAPVLADGDGVAAQLDADLAERQFLVLAWPQERGRSGGEVFAVTSTGVVLRALAPEPYWSGPQAPVPPGAVFAAGKASLSAAPDAMRWQPLQ